MKINIGLLFLFVIAVATQPPAHAQMPYSRSGRYPRRFFLLMGDEIAGLSSPYRFQRQGNILQKGYLKDDGTEGHGVQPNLALAIRYRYSPHFEFESGHQITQMPIAAHDAYFLARNNLSGGASITSSDNTNLNASGSVADRGNFDFLKLYSGYYLSGITFLNSNAWKVTA